MSGAPTGPFRVNCQSSKCATLLDRAKIFMETGFYADCEFLVGANGSDQEVVKAHKAFLAHSSPVFHAMFFGEMAQAALGGKNNLLSPQNDVIAVPDVTPTSFKALLQYIYTQTMNLQSLDQAMGLCYAAHKYIFPDLVAKCMQYIEDNLCPEYTLKVMEFTKLFEDKNLEAKCLSMLRDRTLECLDASDFVDSHESTVLAIVKEDALHIRELELFDGVIRWAKHQCFQRDLEINGMNMRLVLKEIINEIHFLTMTSEEFASSPVHSGVLTENEWAAILVHLNNPDSSLPMPICLSTSQNQRHSVASRLNESQCLREIRNETRVLLDPYFYSHASVMVDKSVMVTGIVVAAADLSCSQMMDFSQMVLMCHLYDDRNVLKAFARDSKPMNHRSITFLPVFDRPIQLERYKTYHIRIAINCRANFLLGAASTTFVSCQGVRFFFHDDFYNDEARNGDLVRGLNFYPC